MDVDALDRLLTDLSGSDRFSGVVRLEVGIDVIFERAYGLAVLSNMEEGARAPIRTIHDLAVAG